MCVCDAPQLNDADSKVAAMALATLDEVQMDSSSPNCLRYLHSFICVSVLACADDAVQACDDEECLEALIAKRPNLLEMGKQVYHLCHCHLTIIFISHNLYYSHYD